MPRKAPRRRTAWQGQVHRDDAEEHEKCHRKGALGLLAGEPDVVPRVWTAHPPILTHGTPRSLDGSRLDSARGVRGPPASSRVDIVVLVSGSGTLLQALIDAASDPAYGVRIAAVGSDRQCSGLDRAERPGSPRFVCRPAEFPSRAEWDAALAERLREVRPRFVVSAGFMRILGRAGPLRADGHQHPPRPCCRASPARMG